MNKPIRILPDLLINKIKAGEVIESPVSVVKELVENSIDAGASAIHVSIVHGGLDEVLVSDNGSGMSEADASLCIERHATSKLFSFSDLESLQTMGFRGEALAAISSISKFEIITKRLSDLHATRIYSEGSRRQRSGSAARECGTSIRVQNLFYNVPARKSFQKSRASLTRAVSQELRKLAIAYPEIHFTLQSDGKELWNALIPKEVDNNLKYLHRIREVLSKDLVENGFPIRRVSGALTLYGITSSPNLTKPNKKEQYLIVNRRVVSCEEIEAVLRDIYSTLIPSHQFPCFVLYLSLPPSSIDVNIHPQKRLIKVKVQEKSEIQKFIRDAFIEALHGSIDWKPADVTFPFPTNAWDSPQSITFREEAVASYVPEKQLTFSIRDQIIGVFNHYLFLKSGLHLLLFDLQGAQEFLSLVAITEALSTKKPIESQSLLLPIELEWSLQEWEWLQAKESHLAFFGFSLELIPPSRSKIIAIPACIHKNDIKDWLTALIQDTIDKRALAKQLARFTKKKSIFTVFDAEVVYERVEKASLNYPGLLGFPLYSELKYETIAQLFQTHSKTTKPIEK